MTSCKLKRQGRLGAHVWGDAEVGILEGGLATEREAEELQGHKSGLSIHSSRGREPREQRALPEPALPCPSFWKTVQEGGGGIPPSWLL